MGPGGSQVEESVGSSCSHGVSDVWVTESLGPVWALTQAGTGWSPSWPIPGVGRGCRWPPRRAGEYPGSPGYLGSQPPGPAAWRVSIWAAGVGEAPGVGVGRTSEAHSPPVLQKRGHAGAGGRGPNWGQGSSPPSCTQPAAPCQGLEDGQNGYVGPGLSWQAVSLGVA